MQDPGFLSIIPPLIAIFLAIKTRQVFISLITGIWLGWVILLNFNPFYGTIATIDAIVNVFQDRGNTSVVLFTLLVGALIAFMQKSGGIEGFINYMGRVISDDSNKLKKNRIKVQLMAAFTGAIIFVESNISALTVGTVFRPIFDKLKISREKLAYIADSTSAPSKLLFPFNGWGAFIMGVLAIQGIENPFKELISSMAYNFYPIFVLLLLFFFILSGRDIGLMKKAEKRANNEGKLFDDGSKPMISEEITMLQTKEGVKPRPFNMILPIASMIFFMPIMLLYTGWDSTINTSSYDSLDLFFKTIGNGSGSSAVLYSVLFALLISGFVYRIKKVLSIKELIETTIKGMSGMVSLALLIILAFAIGGLCKEMGTGKYVAEVLTDHLSPSLIPVVLFIASCIISFSTGTSWGTFAIMLAIAIPLAGEFNINPSLLIAASLGGGLFGDHCSPISDTSVISSMAAASDHIDHVKTQLPYALIAGTLTAIIYLLIGVLTI